MSVAAELARLRAGPFAGGGGLPNAYVPSVIDPSAAGQTPRTEIAGAALNGLESLSAGDGALLSLSRPLLLQDGGRTDRSTLPPDVERAVSRAVVVAAHRLAPVFPLRATQKVLEWVVRGLEAGRLGADAEVDALVVSAIPFCSTEGFVRLTTAVLLPSGRRDGWAWLKPAVKQRKPVSVDYVVAHAPADVFLKAVRQLANSAVAGISVNHLAAFVASAVSRRVLARTTAPLERRQIVLSVLEGVCMHRKRFSVVAGKHEKGAPVPAGVVRSINRAKTALLVVLATAVTAGVEHEIRSTVLQAAVEIMVANTADDASRATAAGCVVLCLAADNFRPMEAGVAKRIGVWGKFAETLAGLSMGERASDTFGLYLAALANGAAGDTRALYALREGLAANVGDLVTDAAVARPVGALLDACSPAQPDAREAASDVTQTIVDTIRPLARGAHAEGLDAGLRAHFDARRKAKGNPSRYKAVDEAIAEAMKGTAFVAVKTSLADSSAGAGGVVQDTLVGSLEHPEACVRLSGLRRLAGEKSLADSAKETPLAETLRGMLMRRVEVDADLRVAALALSSGLVGRFCDAQEAVEAVGKRYREVCAKRKGKKASARVERFCEAGFGYLCRAAAESEEADDMRMAVSALLLGLDMDGLLPPVEARGSLTDSAEFGSLAWKEFPVPVGEMEATVRALFEWDAAWGSRYVKEVFPSLTIGGDGRAPAAPFIRMATDVCKTVISANGTDEAQVAEALKAVLSSLGKLPRLDEAGVGCLRTLWGTVAGRGDRGTTEALVKAIVDSQGTEGLCTFLESDSSCVALEWRAALLKARASGVSSAAFVRDLLFALYASDEIVRESAEGIVRQMRKKELAGVLPAGEMRLLVKLQRALKRTAGGVGDHRLVGQMRDVFAYLRTMPDGMVLDEESFATVSGWVEADDGAERVVAGLRACGGGARKDAFVIGRMTDSLEGDVCVFDDDVRTEILVRLAAMLPCPSDKVSPPSKEAVALTKTLVARAQALRELPAGGREALYGIGVSLALFKLTAILRAGGKNKACDETAKGAVACLFAVSTISGTVGEFVVELISGDGGGVLVEGDFERVAGWLNGRLPGSAAKRRRTRSTVSQKAEEVAEVDAHAAATGALEALGRTEPKSVDPSGRRRTLSGAVLDGLWAFVRGCLENAKSGHAASLDECEYQLSLVLRVLAGHFAAGEGDGSDGVLGGEDASAAVEVCFYPRLENGEEELTMPQRGIRAAAVRLLEMVAGRHGRVLSKHATPFLKEVVTKGAPFALKSFEKIVSSLILGGFPLEAFLRMAMEATDRGMSVTECVRICPDRKRATKAAVSLLKADETGRIVDVVLGSGNTLEDVLEVVGDVGDVASVAGGVLVHAGFLAEVDRYLSDGEDKEEEEGAGGMRELGRLDALFVRLFERLLEQGGRGRERALGRLLDVVPGHLVCRCLQRAVQASALVGVSAVVRRLEKPSPVRDGWRATDEEDDRTRKTGALESICVVLRERVEEEETNEANKTMSEIGLVCVGAIGGIVGRIEGEGKDEVQRVGGVVAGLLNVERPPAITARTLLCMSKIVRSLGQSGGVFVPRMTLSATDLLEGTLASSAGAHASAHAQAAVDVCVDALSVAPRMFGKRELNRIARIAVVSGRRNIANLLHVAVTKVSAANAIGALGGAVEVAKTCEGDACEGIRVVMEGVAKLVQCLRKSDVKRLKMDLLGICLKGLEFRGDFVLGGDLAEDWLEGCRKTEDACFDAIMEIVLRVPESDFKTLFHKLSGWSEGGSFSDEQQAVLEKFEVEADGGMVRFGTLQGLCGRLFGVLRGIMCPYFAGVLDRSLKAVGTDRSAKAVAEQPSNKRQNGSSSTKKRKRKADDGRMFAVAVETLRAEIVNSSLESVTLFLTHVCDDDEVSTATLTRIQESVLSAFDSAGGSTPEIRSALCALALRMIVTGVYRTKEASRQLLCGLSRGILRRTASEGVGLRRGSLELADGVAEAAGDEFLVALPEMMPVLADVVDDEREEVAKAAKALVGRMEGLSGEPILGQLK